MAGTNNGNGEDKPMVDPQKQYLIEQFGNLMEKVGEGYGGPLQEERKCTSARAETASTSTFSLPNLPWCTEGQKVHPLFPTAQNPSNLEQRFVLWFSWKNGLATVLL